MILIVFGDETTYLEVLDANDALNIITAQKIVSIMFFSTEDGKDIQGTQKFYWKTTNFGFIQLICRKIL